jgi:hypothetical protein
LEGEGVKEHTKEAIQEKVQSLWPGVTAEECYGRQKYGVVVECKAGLVAITVSQMYSAPGLSFAQLNALAEFFDTLNVETESEFNHQGCESCDYGSEYGFTIWIRDGAPFTALRP